MPGSQREVANAEEEGVEFVWLTLPGGFEADLPATVPAEIGQVGPDGTGSRFGAPGAVRGVTVRRMKLGEPDATGRQRPETIEGADYVEDADLVIKALGFEPEELPTLWSEPDLEVTRWGTIKADFRTHETGLPGVYAVGDIVRGGVAGGLGDPRRARMRRRDPGAACACALRGGGGVMRHAFELACAWLHRSRFAGRAAPAWAGANAPAEGQAGAARRCRRAGHASAVPRSDRAATP